jgi:hypothetical protein
MASSNTVRVRLEMRIGVAFALTSGSAPGPADRRRPVFVVLALTPGSLPSRTPPQKQETEGKSAGAPLHRARRPPRC